MSDNLLSIQSTCLSFSLKKHNHFCELCVPLPVQRGLVVVLTFSLNLAQEQLPWKPGSWSSKGAEHPHLALTLVGGEAIQHFWRESLVQGQQRNHQLHFSSVPGWWEVMLLLSWSRILKQLMLFWLLWNHLKTFWKCKCTLNAIQMNKLLLKVEDNPTFLQGYL